MEEDSQSSINDEQAPIFTYFDADEMAKTLGLTKNSSSQNLLLNRQPDNLDQRVLRRRTNKDVQSYYASKQYKSAPLTVPVAVLIYSENGLKEEIGRDSNEADLCEDPGIVLKPNSKDNLTAIIESVASGNGNISGYVESYVKRCTLPWCRSSVVESDILLFDLPKMKKERLQKWAEALRWVQFKNTTICSLHFDPVKDFVVRDGKLVLGQRVLPSRILNPNIKASAAPTPPQENEAKILEMPEILDVDIAPTQLMKYLFTKSISLNNSCETSVSDGDGTTDSFDESSDYINKCDEDDKPVQLQIYEYQDPEPERMIVEVQPDLIMDSQGIIELDLCVENDENLNFNDTLGNIWSTPSGTVSSVHQTSDEVDFELKKPNVELGKKKSIKRLKKATKKSKTGLDKETRDLIVQAMRSAHVGICEQFAISTTTLEMLWRNFKSGESKARKREKVES